MNYRHLFHAGNFADVIKHVALVAILLHLRRKERPFCVIDTHAGSGLYDIEGPQAARSREAESGIARIRDLAARDALPDALRTYLECVENEGERRYPGSPRLAVRLLRPQDRLVAIENHPEEAAALRKCLAGFPQARAVEDDGYGRLLALLPPRERRGLVLIDPPYEAADEFRRATELLARAHRCFATGIYLLWFPTKSNANADAASGELRAIGIGPAMRLDIDVDTGARAAGQRLSSAGLFIVNPPYTFEAEMHAAAGFLVPRLGAHSGAPATISLTPL
jgi:23S rRNA (adenine2030-N6)-methyltransferase